MLNVAWGQDKYYVAGTWTNWQYSKIEMTKNADGTYTLANQELEAKARFKIIKVVDGSDPVWCGGRADPGTYSWVTIDNHSNIDLIVNGGEDFYFDIAGTWTITVDPTGETPKLTVGGWPEWEYYLKGDFNGWAISDSYKFSKNESTGKYTLNKPIALGQEFKVYGKRGNEGKWYGAVSKGAFSFDAQYVGTELSLIENGGENFKMNLSNDYNWSLEFDPTKMKLVLRKPFNLKFNTLATDGNYYYATMGNIGIGNFVVPAGVEVSTIEVNNGKITRPRTFSEGDKIPGSKAYLVEVKKENNVADGFVFSPSSDNSEIEIGANMLYPTVVGEESARPLDFPDNDEIKYYKLSLNKEGKNLGFYYGAADGAPFEGITPYSAYLAVPQESGSTPVETILINFDDDADGIQGVSTTEQGSNEAYTLTGVRVKGNLPKGIYIINGRKQVVR